MRKRLLRKTDPLLIACFPKSGSTYLSGLLSRLTGFNCRWFCGTDCVSCEQDIRESRLSLERCVVQQHVKATADNLRLLKQYNIRPVILTRSILDVVPSLRDHYLREGTVGLGNYVPQDWFELAEEQQYDYIIRLILPWYFHFYASWLDAENVLDTLWITYEELFSRQHSTLKDILAFYRIDCPDDQIAGAIQSMDKSTTRFNKGVSGRGIALLKRHHVESIYELARCTGAPPEKLHRMGLYPRLKVAAA